MSVLLVIDGGYYTCFRFFATVRWWTCAHKGKDPADEIETFKTAFGTRFVQSLDDFLRKMNITPYMVVFACDAKVGELWRTELYPDYKKGRTTLSKHGEIARACFDKSFVKSLCDQRQMRMISHPRLEADDCVFLLSSYLNTALQAPTNITVLTNDNDYLQLPTEKISLINLKGENIRSRSLGDPYLDLRVKILSGDKSDNIPPVHSRCGPKTALKIITNPYYRQAQRDKLSDEQLKKADQRANLNQTLIDFNSIPSALSDEFRKRNETIIAEIVETARDVSN